MMNKPMYYKYTSYDKRTIKYFVAWQKRVWVAWQKVQGWSLLCESIDDNQLMIYVHRYPSYYQEVSALEALVVCGRGPWDE